jgi:hypothetical protein
MNPTRKASPPMNRHIGLLVGLIASSFAAFALLACDSNGTGGGQDAATDQATGDATSGDAGNSDADGSTLDAASTLDATTADVWNDTTTSEGGDSEGASACPVFDAGTLDDASVMAGYQQVLQTYRCYGCHQKPTQLVDDAGNGIVLSGNNSGMAPGSVFPPNLTSDPATGLGCWSDQQIVAAILGGMDPDGGSLCRLMPKYGTAQTIADGGPKLGYPMDAATALQIVQYLRSLPVVVNQVLDTICPAGPPDSGADAGSDAALDAASDSSGDAAADAMGQ